MDSTITDTLFSSVEVAMNSRESTGMRDVILRSRVPRDEFTKAACEAFDYEFNGETTFQCWPVPDVGVFQLGLIVGPSGTGKTTLLSRFGKYRKPRWDERAIVSHFKTPAEAISRLTAVGLNTIPAWLRPYSVLSNGEQHRADLARMLGNGAVVDEFTSVVDRNVAKAMSAAVARFIRKDSMSGVVLASCHYDIIEWLCPDWVFDTTSGSLVRGSVRRPPIEIEIRKATNRLWPMFARHHYMSARLHPASRCFVASWNGEIVGFSAALALPSVPNAWREHRTVVLPDYQGLGIGVRLSDAIGELFLAAGKRFYSKTVHPRMGQYRESSPLWRPTAKNRVPRDAYLGKKSKWQSMNKSARLGKVAYSHEYIGAKRPRVL